MIEIKYLYIILLIILAFLIPGILSVLIVLGLSLGVLIYLSLKLFEKNKGKDVNPISKDNTNPISKDNNINNRIDKLNRFWDDVDNPNDRRNALDNIKCGSMTGDDDINGNLMMINSMFPNKDNIKSVDTYYSTLPYEEQFADYGLSKAQKNLLNHNDVSNENASNYNYTKFAKYWGDEMEIKYEDAWYGIDT